jgi:ectoine hydroxylase-related dioxygenase (phytanoyl-CoA dioxygenase family)
MPLMSNLRDEYEAKGYLALNGLLSRAEIDALNQAAVEVCATDQLGRVSFEDVLTIHFPHKLSPFMREMMAHPAITRVLTEVIGPNVKCLQSMFFVKRPGKPGHAWHQDAAYIPTSDNSLLGAWIALDDATIDNGCLWAIPGSHRPGIVWPLGDHDKEGFDVSHEAYGFPYREEESVPVEVQAGSVVFFHGKLLHRSLQNRSAAGYRRALIYHYMDAEALLPWDCSGRLAPTDDNRDIIMVAGVDPHASKGQQDLHTTFLRREKRVEGMPWYIDPAGAGRTEAS